MIATKTLLNCYCIATKHGGAWEAQLRLATVRSMRAQLWRLAKGAAHMRVEVWRSGMKAAHLRDVRSLTDRPAC